MANGNNGLRLVRIVPAAEPGFSAVPRGAPPADIIGPATAPPGVPSRPWGRDAGGVADVGINTPKPATVSVPPPEIYAPPEAIGLDRFGQVSLTGPSTSAAVVGTEFQIPRNMVGVIREVFVAVNNLLITSNIFWSLQFYEAPVAGYENIRVPPTGAAFVAQNRDAESTLIRIPDNARIRITFNVGAGDANTYQVNAQYRGWYYPKSVANRYAQAWR